MSAKSLLFSDHPPLEKPALCRAGRQEVQVKFLHEDRIYTMTMRDKVAVEDPYLMLVKAAAFAVQQDEPYMGRVIPRSVRDFLLKSAVVI